MWLGPRKRPRVRQSMKGTRLVERGKERKASRKVERREVGTVTRPGGKLRDLTRPWARRLANFDVLLIMYISILCNLHTRALFLISLNFSSNQRTVALSHQI